MKKVSILLLAVISVAGIMTGCGNKQASAAEPIEIVSDGDQTTTDTTTTDTTDTSTTEVSHDGMYQSELTNEWISDTLQNQRPIAAMVDNESIALPQYGLTQADVVYEMTNSTMNGGVTRFMVLVKDWESITQLGNIRSIRPTNLMVAPEWNAVICHDGGPFYIDDYLKNPYIDHFSGTFSRVSNGKSREYTEYIVTGDLDTNFTDTGYSTEYNKYYKGAHFQFAADETTTDLSQNSDSVEATHVDLPYQHNKPYLDYNSEDGLYSYSEYGAANTDPANGDAQLAFKNVILQNTTYKVYDEHGYMVFNVIDSGRSGYYITDGKAIPVTWKKTDDVTPTKYYDASGNEIVLNTGKTYIAIIPDDLWDGVLLK